MEYIPLKVYSSYSLLESTVSIPALISKAKEKGYKALALTDKNVMYGAIEFYQEAVKQGIKPILGLSVEVAAHPLKEKDSALTLLAHNQEGFQALMSLSTDVMLNKKRLRLDDLVSFSEQLTVIYDAEANQLTQLHKESAAESLKAFHSQLNYFYVGIQWKDHQERLINELVDTIRSLSIQPVVMEAVTGLEPADVRAAEVLKAIKEQQTLSEGKKEDEQNLQHILKTPMQVSSFYEKKGLLSAVQATVEISERIELDFDWQPMLPEFNTPDTLSSEAYLKQVSWEWLQKTVPGANEQYQTRLNKELQVICKMGFADYFLIIWDLMKYAHRENIATGSGRGSAAGSLVSYVLRITDVDPVVYDLLFDRFLNEERFTLPDIDLDFPDDKREKILAYVHDKYGYEHVAQIATFGTFAAKMAVRDVGRTYGLTTDELKKWSQAIPSRPGISLEEAYKESAELRQLTAGSDTGSALFSVAKRIEGLPRHVSTHAAGVVISKEPLIYSTPLQEGSGVMPLTQFTMNDVETVGLLKMDFLGLKNLTILSDCLSLTKSLKGKFQQKVHQIPLDDSETLALFKKGDTNGIFQFESTGIQRVLKKLKPTHFEDIVAVNALYRPGPMEQIDTYIARKKGEQPITYPHPDLSDILDVTYGVMVYQEQVMKVASKIAGYSLAEADILRRAISKKIKVEIDAGRNHFVAGAKEVGYSRDIAVSVYDLIERFANYGFNRSHAVSYSKLAFQLAYFKVHEPEVFFVSLLKSSANNKDKVRKYIMEAKGRGVSISKPDINKSAASFTVNDQAITFGLDSIKGIRKDFIRHILFERRQGGSYKDMQDFLRRIDQRWRKQAIVLPLIQAGCFDELGDSRATLIHSLDSVLDSIQMSNGNLELFASLTPRIEKIEELPFEERLKQEYQVTGFYLSGHPTEKFTVQNRKFLTMSEAGSVGSYIIQVEEVKKIQTKKGEPMAFLNMSDSSGEGTGVLFPAVYRKCSRLLTSGALLEVTGKAEIKKGQMNILINQVSPASYKVENTQQFLFIKFDELSQEKEKLKQVLSILSSYQGTVPVIVYDAATTKKEKLKSKFNVDPVESCLKDLSVLLGSDYVQLR
ncbi:DNA polymerase III alpha subunit [Alkalibacterium sp. AK22]|uniref:DNA polymerase III subunit alpha n=1 Tax=Alkalibacterium sp. AK22 TaxID=1229520 RepID=UPI00044E1B04|nr:DNA polymerase III subunit alpha [Alkalibacterium sp. AK22]EXJ24206.1 DNA polymerase III alpha subunit [Alkalibacterium sp. AK22]